MREVITIGNESFLLSETQNGYEFREFKNGNIDILSVVYETRNKIWWIIDFIRILYTVRLRTRIGQKKKSTLYFFIWGLKKNRFAWTFWNFVIFILCGWNKKMVDTIKNAYIVKKYGWNYWFFLNTLFLLIRKISIEITKSQWQSE